MDTASTPLEQAVRKFMLIGGQTVDQFSSRQATLYLGLQLEELCEKLEAVSEGCITTSDKNEFTHLIAIARRMSDRLKAGRHQGDVLRANRTAMLDADIDLAWVSLGAAFSISNNAIGAVHEVAASNLAKFPNGVAVRDSNGKIVKPANWRPPQLGEFIDTPID